MGNRKEKVWAVTEGSYSDYRVIAVFTTEAMAKEAVEKGMGDAVEDLPMYEEVPERISILTIGCRMPVPSGKKWGLHKDWEPFREWSHTELIFPDIDTWRKRLQVNHTDQALTVSGADHERVRKVFGEKKAEAGAAWHWLV